MSDEQPSASANSELATKIVAAYVRRNQVTPDQLSALISTVHQALGRLSKPPAAPIEERTPAVSIRRSVTANFVVCIECG